MTAPRQPQDHKPKKAEPALDAKTVEPLTYVALDGTEYLVDGAPLVDKITPGFMRRARNKDQMTLTFDLVEMAVTDGALLDLLDASWEELARFDDAFGAYWTEILGASMGESSAS